MRTLLSLFPVHNIIKLKRPTKRRTNLNTKEEIFLFICTMQCLSSNSLSCRYVYLNFSTSCKVGFIMKQKYCPRFCTTLYRRWKLAFSYLNTILIDFKEHQEEI